MPCFTSRHFETFFCYMKTLYRVRHNVSDLGWVDFDFGYYMVCLILLGLMGKWQNWLSSWAR